jgi:hypothetical protein
MLRDADDLMLTAVCATIDALDLTPADAAAVRLARDYAAQIDASRDEAKLFAWSMRNTAPLLLDVLQALGATPAARAALTKGVKAPDAPGQLAKLRAARRA